jgi:hypothetical protein
MLSLIKIFMLVIIISVIAVFVLLYPGDCKCQPNSIGKCKSGTQYGSHQCRNKNIMKKIEDNIGNILTRSDNIITKIPSTIPKIPYINLKSINFSKLHINELGFPSTCSVDMCGGTVSCNPNVSSKPSHPPATSAPPLDNTLVTNTSGSSGNAFGIQNVRNGRCLDRNTPGVAYLMPCTDDSSQKWYWDGKQLKNKLDDKCLDYKGTDDIYMERCTGSSYQEWIKDDDKIRNNHTGKCLDFSTDDTPKIFGCVDNTAQKWKLLT